MTTQTTDIFAPLTIRQADRLRGMLHTAYVMSRSVCSDHAHSCNCSPGGERWKDHNRWLNSQAAMRAELNDLQWALVKRIGPAS